MGIQLISISHKNADLPVREKFSFPEEMQEKILQQLHAYPLIDECVMIGTCNRTEVYTWSSSTNEREIYEFVQSVLFEMAGMSEQDDVGKVLRFYGGKKAMHHLFLVASGLDSMVIGEDQILGQVKDAWQMAFRLGMTGTYLNTFFRYAVTAAKKVKTDTALSKTPVSTAVICIREAEHYLGSLDGKNVLIIGSGGKIGSVVLKNLLSDYAVNVFVTKRGQELLQPQKVEDHKYKKEYTVIPYEQRYDFIARMDVIISATSSPHYTLTYASVAKCLKACGDRSNKKRAFMDLAVPLDIESRIGTLDGVLCSNIDDFGKTAKENNEIKLKEADAALKIIEEYEQDFEKWLIFQNSLSVIKEAKELILKDANDKDIEKALDKFFYRVRENANPAQLEVFMECIADKS